MLVILQLYIEIIFWLGHFSDQSGKKVSKLLGNCLINKILMKTWCAPH